MADEPVVVTKSRPVKAGNSVEGKTKATIDIVFDGVNICQKRYWLRRGEVFFKANKKRETDIMGS